MFAGSTVVFAIWSVVLAAGPERGYLATNIEPIGQLQAQVLGLQEDVTEIKTTVEASATQIVAIATAQAQGFVELQRAFAELQAGQGTLVANPTTPQECYSNARLYQLRGDTANAIKAYECYLGFDLEFVDPFYEYTALLNATQGIARRARRLTICAARPDSATLELIATRLVDAPAERLQRLIALAARSPQYGPVFDELGQEYDRAIAGNVTSDLLKKQAEAYGKLLQAGGEPAPVALLHRQGAGRCASAERATRCCDAFANAAKVFSNIDVQIYAFANGVQFIVILPEVSNAKQLLFSIDDPDPKTDAGKTGAGAQTFVNTQHRTAGARSGRAHVLHEVRGCQRRGKPRLQQSIPRRSDCREFHATASRFLDEHDPGALQHRDRRARRALNSTRLPTALIHRRSISRWQASRSRASMSQDLAKGDHTLYIQATGSDGKKTDVVEYKFTVK